MAGREGKLRRTSTGRRRLDLSFTDRHRGTRTCSLCRNTPHPRLSTRTTCFYLILFYLSAITFECAINIFARLHRNKLVSFHWISFCECHLRPHHSPHDRLTVVSTTPPPPSPRQTPEELCNIYRWRSHCATSILAQI